MFVREERSLGRSFEAVVEEFAQVPRMWLPDIAEATLGTAEGASARLDAAGLSKKVSIQVGSALRETARAVMPMRVVATGPAGLFPQLDADLELLATGPSTVMLRLTGSYRVPLGTAGRLLDRMLLHRAAEASLRHFLKRVSERLLALT